MRTIQTKDGIVLQNIPDHVTDEQIKARLAKIRGQSAEPVQAPQSSPLPQPVQAQPSFMEKTLQDIQTRMDNVSNISKELHSKKTSADRQLMALHGMAQAPKVAVDIAGNAVSDFTPEVVKEGYKTFINAIPKDVRNSATKFAGYISDLLAKHPETSRTLDTALTLYGATQVKELIWKGKPPRGGFHGERKLAFDKDYADLIAKPQTTKLRTIEAAKGRNVSPLGTKTTPLTSREKDIARILKETPGVDPGGKLIQTNINIVNRAKDKAYQQFVKQLRAARVQIKPAEIQKRLDMALDDAFNTAPEFAGKSYRQVEVIKDQAKRIIKKNKLDLEGLYKSRIELDQFGKKTMKFHKGLRKEVDTARSVGMKATRDALNKLLIEKAKGIDVEGYLKRQSLYLEAVERMAPNAAIEMDTMLGRMGKKVENIPAIGKKQVKIVR